MQQDTSELRSMYRRFRKQYDAVDKEWRLLAGQRGGLQKTLSGIQQMIETIDGPMDEDEVNAADPEESDDQGNGGDAGAPSPFVTPRPPVSATGSTNPRRGKAAAWEIFRANPGVTFNAATLLAALREQGWEPDSEDPEGVLRVTIRRLMDDRPDEIKRVAYGQYAYQPEEA